MLLDIVMKERKSPSPISKPVPEYLLPVLRSPQIKGPSASEFSIAICTRGPFHRGLICDDQVCVKAHECCECQLGSAGEKNGHGHIRSELWFHQIRSFHGELEDGIGSGDEEQIDEENVKEEKVEKLVVI